MLETRKPHEQAIFVHHDWNGSCLTNSSSKFWILELVLCNGTRKIGIRMISHSKRTVIPSTAGNLLPQSSICCTACPSELIQKSCSDLIAALGFVQGQLYLTNKRGWLLSLSLSLSPRPPTYLKTAVAAERLLLFSVIDVLLVLEDRWRRGRWRWSRGSWRCSITLDPTPPLNPSSSPGSSDTPSSNGSSSGIQRTFFRSPSSSVPPPHFQNSFFSFFLWKICSLLLLLESESRLWSVFFLDLTSLGGLKLKYWWILA